ncbi:MAG: holo-ACP synthase [Clostridiales bacterium]|nr:holo-ACP synthase [Clostridiales bacterium]
MYAIGLDMTELSRIEHSMKNRRFCRRILGQREYDQLAGRGMPVQSVAASFAAKEAFGKALGTGIRGFALREVELLRRETGEPYLHLSGNAAKMAEGRGCSFCVSVTHTKTCAAAVVLGFGRENV